MKRTVTLDIAGAKYRMTSDAEEVHLQRLASMIEERIGALGLLIAAGAAAGCSNGVNDNIAANPTPPPVASEVVPGNSISLFQRLFGWIF